jgi:predicted ribosomally synthesized peptide with SipW-like signal peptide
LTDSADTKTSTKRQKTMAVLAAGLVLGLGATVTLAVWNDSEWVTGGVDNNADGTPDTPGVGTSIFEVEQNVSVPYADTDAAWASREANPGGALTFTAGALSLTPGDEVYAPVSLQTTATSVAATGIALSGAVAASGAGLAAVDADGLLFSALQLRVVAATTTDAASPAACSVAAFGAGATYVVGGPALTAGLATAGTFAPTLAAAGADKANYCFEISLPDTAPSTLQGRQVAPAWQFIASSVED